MPSNHLVLCRPLLLMSSVFPCIRVCINRTALLWPYQPDEETRAGPARGPAWVMLRSRADRVSDSITQEPFWFAFSRQEQWLRYCPLLSLALFSSLSRLDLSRTRPPGWCLGTSEWPLWWTAIATLYSHYLSMSSMRTGTMSAWLSSVYPQDLAYFE